MKMRVVFVFLCALASAMHLHGGRHSKKNNAGGLERNSIPRIRGTEEFRGLNFKMNPTVLDRILTAMRGRNLSIREVPSLRHGQRQFKVSPEVYSQIEVALASGRGVLRQPQILALLAPEVVPAAADVLVADLAGMHLNGNGPLVPFQEGELGLDGMAVSDYEDEQSK